MNMEYHVFRPVNHDWRLTNEFPNQGREDDGWMVLKECERMLVDSHGAPTPPPPIPLVPPLLFCRAGSGLCSRKILQQLDCGSCARAAPTYHRRGSDNIWWQTHYQHDCIRIDVPLNTNTTIHQILSPGSPVLWQEIPTKTAGEQPCLYCKVTIFWRSHFRIKYWLKSFGPIHWAWKYPLIMMPILQTKNTRKNHKEGSW